MPSCFSLSHKTNLDKRVNLNDLDLILCKYLDVPYSEDFYCYNWYDTYGFWIATGNPLGSMELKNKAFKAASEIEDKSYGYKFTLILFFLEKHFVSDSWHEFKSHPRERKELLTLSELSQLVGVKV